MPCTIGCSGSRQIDWRKNWPRATGSWHTSDMRLQNGIFGAGMTGAAGGKMAGREATMYGPPATFFRASITSNSRYYCIKKQYFSGFRTITVMTLSCLYEVRRRSRLWKHWRQSRRQFCQYWWRQFGQHWQRRCVTWKMLCSKMLWTLILKRH